MTNPFLDPAAIQGSLYHNSQRLSSRTSALSQAKIAGPPAVDTIRELLGLLTPGSILVDVGCGPGSLASALAGRYPQAVVAGIDQSAALCAMTRERLRPAQDRGPAAVVRADFHQLPFGAGRVAAAVAAFSLYHSATPIQALTEIRRCLRSGGQLVAATKSTDSYRELDDLVAQSGLDPDAARHQSLYEAFHGGNAPNLVAQVLDVTDVAHQRHQFQFDDFDHLSRYLATSPKYDVHPFETPEMLADQLRECCDEAPFVMTSTVTYVKAVKP